MTGINLEELPYLKSGINALASNAAADDYLERNHADDASIVNSTIVEGEILVNVKTTEDNKEAHLMMPHYLELSSDIRTLLRTIRMPRKRLRFSFNGTDLDMSTEILPSLLGMESRGEYIIGASVLSRDQVKVQEDDANKKREAKELALQKRRRFSAISIQKRVRGIIVRGTYLKTLQRVISIQKVVRGVIVREAYLKTLQPRFDAVCHFYTIWRGALEQVPPSRRSLTGWALVREILDLKRVDLLDEDGNLADTDEKLNQALSIALSEEDESEEIGDEGVDEALDNLTLDENQVNVHESIIDWTQFQVSVHILRPSVCSVFFMCI